MEENKKDAPIIIDDKEPKVVQSKKFQKVNNNPEEIIIKKKTSFWEKPFWNKIVNYDFKQFKDRIRFTITFVLIGLLVIILGNLFTLEILKNIGIALKGAGVMCFIIGLISIILGIVVPIIHYADEHDW